MTPTKRPPKKCEHVLCTPLMTTPINSETRRAFVMTGDNRTIPVLRPQFFVEVLLAPWVRTPPQRSQRVLEALPFTTAHRTLSIRCAPRGDQRIYCWAFIRRWSSHCTVLSVVAVEIGSLRRRAVA
jgi:hypothetical protein